MNGRDRIVVASLVVAFAVISAAIGAESAARPTPSPTPSAGLAEVRGYREGMVGRPSSINPLTARTAADRALVSLVFSGLVRLGPGSSIVPDLAERWTIAPDGSAYTFELRRDAVWHDGTPVTAADVVFTVRTLQDPAYRGPAATSWREVHATEVDRHTVRLELATPLAGFLVAATQPIAPAHLLGDVPVDLLADHPFNQQPVGSGPFRLVSWNAGEAHLEPALDAPVEPDSDPTGPGGGTPIPTDTIATPRPTARPDRPLPYLPWMDLRFYGNAGELEAAYRSGEVDVAVGLGPKDATALASTPGSRLLRYPRATLSTVVFDLRPARPEFRDPLVRRALLEAIDRDALVTGVLDGSGLRADAPIPPSSPAFDPSVSREVPHDPAAAAKDLAAAGWSKVGKAWAAPKTKTAYELELIAPDAASNPVAWATAEAVAADWTALGFEVALEGLPAATFVGERLQRARFAAAVVDVNVGLDPDLYPLLASTQTASGGSNVSGLQSPALDKLLVAARKPGTDAARKAAWAKLQATLAEQQYLLPLFFRDEPVVLRDVVQGPEIRQIGDVGDRYWDVLTWRLATSR